MSEPLHWAPRRADILAIEDEPAVAGLDLGLGLDWVPPAVAPVPGGTLGSPRAMNHGQPTRRQPLGGGEPGPAAFLRPLTTLVGREREVDEVLGRLEASDLLSLTGAPGVGKSRLAFEVASRLQASGSTSAVVVSVDWLPSERHVAVAVADALAHAQAQLADHGQSGDVSVLVVLDDCDRWLDACADEAHTLVVRGVRVLTTSREPLRAVGESVWRVPQLPVPTRGHDELPEVFTESEAVRLFCDRAAAAHRGFIPTPETASAIGDICRRLDGVPLAIELAAGKVRAYSPADIVARLESPFGLLANGPRTAPPRHRSLWACLAWSYDLLTATEQLLLERLGVFPGSFSEEAATLVCAPEGMVQSEVADILVALLDKSLIEVDGHAGGAQYRLLDMTRRFAAEKLAAVGEEDALGASHARWCVGLLGAAGDRRQGRQWLSRVSSHHGDVGVALEWSIGAGDGEAAAVLVVAAAWLYRAEGRHREADATIERVVALDPVPEPAGWPSVLILAGESAAARGELALAVACLEHGVGVAEGNGEGTEAARARLVLRSIEALGTGDPRQLDAEVALARHGDPSLAVDALIACGWAHLHTGEPAVAVERFSPGLDLAEGAGDELGAARALVGLGVAQVQLGRYGDGEAALGRGYEMSRAMGEAHTAGMALGWLGESARLQGAAALAENWFHQGVELTREAGHPYPLSLALLGLGRLAVDAGNLMAAAESFEAALAAAGTGPISPLLASCLYGLAEVAPDHANRRRLLDEAVAVARRCGDRTGEASALYGLGRLSQVQGDWTSATRRYREALRLQAGVGDPAAIADSIEALAVLAATRGDFLTAARLLGAAESLRSRHGCPRPSARRDQNAAVEEAACAGLGGEAFAAARHEGAALSREAAVASVVKHGGKCLPRPTTGWAALTRGEETVARLVAEGHTNKEIARELGVAATTVKAHLRNIYAKLGLQTRAALGAEVHRQVRT